MFAFSGLPFVDVVYPLQFEIAPSTKIFHRVIFKTIRSPSKDKISPKSFARLIFEIKFVQIF